LAKIKHYENHTLTNNTIILSWPILAK
jgi:hypothetical protein